MTVKKLNDAPVLDQLDEHWMKLAALILWKTSGTAKIKITTEDFEAFRRLYPLDGGPVIFTHGHRDSFDFQIVSDVDATRIAEHQKTQEGRS